MWLLFALGYHMGIAAWVGLIALIGVDAETGVCMLLYLDTPISSCPRDAWGRSVIASSAWCRRSVEIGFGM